MHVNDPGFKQVALNIFMKINKNLIKLNFKVP